MDPLCDDCMSHKTSRSNEILPNADRSAIQAIIPNVQDELDILKNKIAQIHALVRTLTERDAELAAQMERLRVGVTPQNTGCKAR
jgi:hypothetical protein